MIPLAYAGQYAHHAGGIDWVLNAVVHAVAAIVVVAFLAYRRRA